MALPPGTLDAILTTGAVKWACPGPFVFITDDKHLDDIARGRISLGYCCGAIQLGGPATGRQ